jgi:4-hydroxybenzoyl-CoA thioesterase
MPASHIHTYPVRVEFGDCDPAQIVWYPNFYRWMDAASRHFFVACGVPLWSELERTTGVIGTPIVDMQARFMKPATYGDRLEIDTEVTEWRNKSFVMRHRVRRGEDVLCECTEVRVFAMRVEGDRMRIRAAPVPQDIRRLCEGDAAAERDLG